MKLEVTLPIDNEGMIGRECPNCKNYFKLNPNTGFNSETSYCPYCDYSGTCDDFITKDQLKYVKAKALNKAMNIISARLTKSFKELEKSTRTKSVKFTFKGAGNNFNIPVKFYSEKELETKITCNNCGQEFAIYGVFSRCPDCSELNAFIIYFKSLEVNKKKLDILQKPGIEKDILSASLESFLLSCVASFDGLGKELKKRKTNLYPDRPKNLFQNLDELNKSLNNYLSDNHSNYKNVYRLFQVRHLYDHNMGVVDRDFKRKVSGSNEIIGRKYLLKISELEDMLLWMQELGELIKVYHENH